jgi:hypothetical protein
MKRFFSYYKITIKEQTKPVILMKTRLGDKEINALAYTP